MTIECPYEETAFTTKICTINKNLHKLNVRSKWKSDISKQMSEWRSERMSEGMSKWPISDILISTDLCKIHKGVFDKTLWTDGRTLL